MYDGESSEGLKGSYEISKSEGDVLYKQGEYKKALESFNQALEHRPGDKNSLIARSQCYLQLGDSKKALADADETLKEDPNYVKGILQKAEANYQIGQFEHALMFYHKGNKLRPEVKAFRLGIQKSQEAIDNSIGESAGINLENKGDLAYFYEEQQQEQNQNKKGKGGYGRPSTRGQGRKKDEKRSKATPAEKKAIKKLLGDLYGDHEYLEKLLEECEGASNKSDTNKEVQSLTENCLNYLDTRTKFWQQQKPMYSRKKKGEKRSGSAQSQSAVDWVLKNIEEIDAEQAEGNYESSLKKAKKVLKEVEKWSDNDIKNRQEVVANLHSCMGNAYLEMGNYEKALEHHNCDSEIATQHDIEDAKSRALDNLGRVYARMGKYDKAIDVWERKLPMSKSALESTWLYHELGRCYLEINDYEKAREMGEKSLKAAEEADDEVWQLNASVLVAQSEVKVGDFQAASISFEKALEMAKVQEDKAAESAIKKALEDLNSKMVKGIKEGGEEGETEASHAVVQVENSDEEIDHYQKLEKQAISETATAINDNNKTDQHVTEPEDQALENNQRVSDTNQQAVEGDEQVVPKKQQRQVQQKVSDEQKTNKTHTKNANSSTKTTSDSTNKKKDANVNKNKPNNTKGATSSSTKTTSKSNKQDKETTNSTQKSKSKSPGNQSNQNKGTTNRDAKLSSTGKKESTSSTGQKDSRGKKDSTSSTGKKDSSASTGKKNSTSSPGKKDSTASTGNKGTASGQKTESSKPATKTVAKDKQSPQTTSHSDQNGKISTDPNQSGSKQTSSSDTQNSNSGSKDRPDELTGKNTGTADMSKPGKLAKSWEDPNKTTKSKITQDGVYIPSGTNTNNNNTSDIKQTREDGYQADVEDEEQQNEQQQDKEKEK